MAGLPIKPLTVPDLEWLLDPQQEQSDNFLSDEEALDTIKQGLAKQNDLNAEGLI